MHTQLNVHNRHNHVDAHSLHRYFCANIPMHINTQQHSWRGVLHCGRHLQLCPRSAPVSTYRTAAAHMLSTLCLIWYHVTFI